MAATGENAVDYVKKERPDLILMDIHLRGTLDGIETSRHIRAVYPVPIIFMTGFEDEANKKSALELEPLDYLFKPVDIGRLIKKITGNFPGIIPG